MTVKVEFLPCRLVMVMAMVKMKLLLHSLLLMMTAPLLPLMTPSVKNDDDHDCDREDDHFSGDGDARADDNEY